MKVVIIGGVAGGATAAARIRRLDESAEIIIYEKGNHNRRRQGYGRHSRQDLHVSREGEDQHPRHLADGRAGLLQHDDDRRLREVPQVDRGRRGGSRRARPRHGSPDPLPAHRDLREDA